MSLDRGRAAEFVDRYGQTWERWDNPGFVELFSDEVVYVAHPEEVVVGREALSVYLRKEEAEQGAVSVHMGKPIVEGDHVVAEFWVTAINQGVEATIAGCFIARLDAEGRCSRFREYWFDIDGHSDTFEGWGE
jgi:ketosteroid isomerase-like protein